jgi:hypothetical protein
MRTNMKLLALIPAFALVACDRGSDRAMDDALKNDLALANQVAPNQVVSPLERGDTSMLAATAPTTVGATAGAATVRRTTPRTTTVRRSSASTARRSSSGGTRVIYREPAPQPETRVIKHTKRDAIIGAAAGAAIGAATSKDRLKGAVIGAAAGGILGGIIGNNVDVKRVPQY